MPSAETVFHLSSFVGHRLIVHNAKNNASPPLDSTRDNISCTLIPMAPRSTNKAVAEKTAKKVKSTGGGGKKKLSLFNKFMQSEMARLKEEEPDMQHKDRLNITSELTTPLVARFKLATTNWKTSKENPKAA
ncbi:LOW QUALITY PROTEIN: hypothetical protein CVT25_014851 [Psilocybe cyanescens]|uniref:Uncharacterized protein n=1 Tax=Psilocybe cyanescens TaxID=93625 RepID=A0A409WEU0_PSICY|nr:LOW QUALITY PROTEIN: hypothetical protein CVT25_014851 [Psilocybe cyanescens]